MSGNTTYHPSGIGLLEGLLPDCPSSRGNDPESARFVASIRLPRPSVVQFMRWGFAIWTGERTRATRPAMPVNRICPAQTAYLQRARLCSTWHAFLSGVRMETVRPFSKGRFGTYETENSQSFRCNKAAREHGPARSAGGHLSACYSSFAIAVGRHCRGSGTLHAGRRSRSGTIFLRDAGNHDSRQAWRYLALVGADGIWAGRILWLRPHRESRQQQRNAKRGINSRPAAASEDRGRAPHQRSCFAGLRFDTARQPSHLARRCNSSRRELHMGTLAIGREPYSPHQSHSASLPLDRPAASTRPLHRIRRPRCGAQEIARHERARGGTLPAATRRGSHRDHRLGSSLGGARSCGRARIPLAPMVACLVPWACGRALVVVRSVCTRADVDRRSTSLWHLRSDAPVIADGLRIFPEGMNWSRCFAPVC